MSTLKKSWALPTAGYRKFIASVLSYALSKELDRKKFEVVHEGNIDLHNPESDTPDVIVYDKKNNASPALIVELCFNNNEEDTLRTVEIIRELYAVKEAFVYNIEADTWKCFTPDEVVFTSTSNLFKIELNELLSTYLHRYI